MPERPRFVLVVDDDDAVRDSVREELAVLGVPTIGAGDGMQALDTVARLGLPAGVVTDLHMPRLDGLGLIHELRSDQAGSRPTAPSMPILLMSGDQLPPEVPDDVELASKPVPFEELEAFVLGLDLPSSSRTKFGDREADPTRPTVIVNPASDEVFAEFTAMLVDHGVTSIWELERRLQAIYPEAAVHARQLDAAPWIVWYIQRDGPSGSARDSTRREERANVEQE